MARLNAVIVNSMSSRLDKPSEVAGQADQEEMADKPSSPRIVEFLFLVWYGRNRMSLFDEIHAIREQISLDYQDYMQAFAIQREALVRQEQALKRYQEKTNLVLDRIQSSLLKNC